MRAVLHMTKIIIVCCEDIGKENPRGMWFNAYYCCLFNYFTHYNYSINKAKVITGTFKDKLNNCMVDMNKEIQTKAVLLNIGDEKRDACTSNC